MKSSALLIPLVFALLFGSLSQAQAPAQKLYRWVDAEGNVRYTDSLPPEAVDQARRELSKASGNTTADISRAMTGEERARIQAEVERNAAAAAEAQTRAQRDSVLINAYATEAELTRAFGDRLSMLQESIRAAQIGIESQQYVLASLLNDAADRELAGERVPPTVLEAVREAYRQEQQLRDVQLRREAEHAATDQDYQNTLERYRTLSQSRE
jgi:hemoglobin-like flavoprotein